MTDHEHCDRCAAEDAQWAAMEAGREAEQAEWQAQYEARIAAEYAPYPGLREALYPHGVGGMPIEEVLDMAGGEDIMQLREFGGFMLPLTKAMAMDGLLDQLVWAAILPQPVFDMLRAAAIHRGPRTPPAGVQTWWVVKMGAPTVPIAGPFVDQEDADEAAAEMHGWSVAFDQGWTHTILGIHEKSQRCGDPRCEECAGEECDCLDCLTRAATSAGRLVVKVPEHLAYDDGIRAVLSELVDRFPGEMPVTWVVVSVSERGYAATDAVVRTVDPDPELIGCLRILLGPDSVDVP